MHRCTLRIEICNRSRREWFLNRFGCSCLFSITCISFCTLSHSFKSQDTIPYMCARNVLLNLHELQVNACYVMCMKPHRTRMQIHWRSQASTRVRNQHAPPRPDNMRGYIAHRQKQQQSHKHTRSARDVVKTFTRTERARARSVRCKAQDMRPLPPPPLPLPRSAQGALASALGRWIPALVQQRS